MPEPSESKPVPNANPPNVQKSSSMLSVLGGEDLSAIFGEWAKADTAENAGGIGLSLLSPADTAKVSVGAAPPLRSTPPPLPEAMANQQLEAIAPPALLRMAM